jgi:hypothetical protein
MKVFLAAETFGDGSGSVRKCAIELAQANRGTRLPSRQMEKYSRLEREKEQGAFRLRARLRKIPNLIECSAICDVRHVAYSLEIGT